MTTKNETKPAQRDAMARLRRDWKELQSEPIINIAAEPLESNIFEWHVNLRPASGPYYESGCLFHVILMFPDTYPANPPTVRLCSTKLKHPNIFHGFGNYGQGMNYPYVCLDMIKDANQSGPYTGWSSAYSVFSLLMQLSAFLFDVNVPQEHGGSRTNHVDAYECVAAIREARNFKCSGCNHTLVAPMPYIRVNSNANFNEAQFIANHEQKQRKKSHSRPCVPVPDFNSSVEFPHLVASTTASVTNNKLLKQLPDELVNVVLDSLNSTDLQRVALLEDSRLKEIRDKYHRVTMSELRCYFHRTGLLENDLLGVGLAIDYYKDGQGIRNLSSPLDILSYRAFQTNGVRLSVWKEEFTHFIPLAINSQHNMHSLPLLEQELARIRKSTGFDAAHTLDILCGLMNSMVVSLMKTEPTTARKAHAMRQRRNYYSDDDDDDEVVPDFKISIWQSEKAMLGYCAFHHLLLAMCARQPTLQAEAEKRVRVFLQDARSRTKHHVPNLGELVVLSTVVESTTLDQLLPVILPEMLARNVRWAFREHPVLELDKIVPCRRISTTFAASRTSMRLLMFQTHFVRLLCSPGKDNNSTRLQDYNKSYGRPRLGIADELQQACQEINKVNDWQSFLRRLGMNESSPIEVHTMLLNAIRRSTTLRYHTRSNVASTGPYWCECVGVCTYRAMQVAEKIEKNVEVIATHTPVKKPHVKYSRRAVMRRISEAETNL